jgi:glutamate synthase domain-containing protein 1
MRDMCGIAGLFAKSTAVEERLGALLTRMLIELSDRGPDSAGVALYREPAPSGWCKVTLEGEADWEALERELGAAGPAEVHGTHAVLTVPADAVAGCERPGVRLISAGRSIELFKQAGAPADVLAALGLEELRGSHGLGHTRMATESLVTTEHSHPFSTGGDVCLVHNGSLSNHNRLRLELRRRGISFRTDNDSEVAAGYLSWRLGEGLSLDAALESCLTDLDGFYTFAIGTADGFAVLRDPIACKPAVLAETDDWVAMASEYRAIAVLPGAEEARVWEPAPGRVYTWERALVR